MTIDSNRLGKTAVRCMALHIRMMRLLGRMSLNDIELLLEHGHIDEYERGAAVPVAVPGRRCHLLVLEGEVSIHRDDPAQTGDDPTAPEILKAADAVYGYVPVMMHTDSSITVTAVTPSRCLLLDADLADRLSSARDSAGMDGRRIA